MEKRLLTIGVMLFAWLIGTKAEVDPNFYIYLCFGQSNMEGNAAAESVDKLHVDQRFKMLATTNFSSPQRTMGQWYTATPPIVSPIGGLGMADYFGRTMVAALPANVKVGVVDVAIGGCAIQMFDKTEYKSQVSKGDYSAGLANQYYGGNPYKRLVDMAKKAQESGVIKGILLHQGCSNNGDPNWPNMVNKIYTDILSDLGLSADSVPLFAGETLRQEYGGGCYAHNTVVAKLPSVIPTSHVISSEGCEGNGKDAWHFCATGYRIMGRRYAFAALQLMNVETKADPDYTMHASLKRFFAVKSLTMDSDIKALPGQHIKATAVFEDNHKEDVSADMRYVVTSGNIAFTDAAVASKGEGQGTADAVYTDFTRKQITKPITVDVRYFPLTQGSLTQLSGTLTFDEAERSIKMGGSGQAGWVYDNWADMSDYHYLVLKLKQPQNIYAELRVYAQASITNGGFSKEIGKATTVVVDLKNLKYSSRTINPARIKMVTFRFGKAGTLYIDDIYLTNEDPTATGVTAIDSDVTASQTVFTLQGVKVGTTSQWDKLPRGIYAVGNRLLRK